MQLRPPFVPLLGKTVKHVKPAMRKGMHPFSIGEHTDSEYNSIIRKSVGIM